MNKESFWFWVLLALLVLGMLATLWFGRGRTRHGFGALVQPGPGSGPAAMAAAIDVRA